MLASRAPVCSLVGSILLAMGCGGPVPASIQAPDRYEIEDTKPVRIGAMALDEAGKRLGGVEVFMVDVGDPALLVLGANGELRCQKWGRTTVTMEASPVRKDIVVSCLLVKEVRGAPQKLVTVLEVDAEGHPVPMDLSTFAFQAIGLDGKAISDAPIEISVDAGETVEQDADGRIRAVQPGRATISGSLAGHVATLEVEVGLLVSLRKSVLIEGGESMEIAVDPGRYRVSTGSDVELRIRAVDGRCGEHDAATAIDQICTFESSGMVRVEHPGIRGQGEDAQVTVRLVRLP